MDTITGCWRGALVDTDGQREMQFALDQPSHTTGERPVISINGKPSTARLLDAAQRSFVALTDTPEAQRPGSFLHLLMEARVLGDRLVGRWLYRDNAGEIVARGLLTGVRG
jgi:hypothetical protein